MISKHLFAALSLAMFTLLVNPAIGEDNEGQTDLDLASEVKLGAKNAKDLERVVELVESAIEKGLDEENEKFARQLGSATLYETATLLTNQIFEADKPHARWPLLRQIAVPQLQKAVKLQPDMIEAHMMIAKLQALPGGARDMGQEAADEAIKLAADDNTELAKALVLRARLADDENKRMADLNQAVKIDPANDEALKMRGLLFLASEEHEKAIEDFKKLIKVDGEEVTAYQAISEAYTQIEEYDKALEYADKAIELEPESSLGFSLRARVHIMQEKNDEAIKDLNKAIDVGPRDVNARLLRAQLLYEADKFKDALTDVEKALLLRPGLERGIFLRAMISAADEKYDDAIRDIQKLLEADEDNLGYRLQLAAYMSASDRPRASIELYDELVEEDGENTFALRGRADALLAIGEHAKAIADYETILKLDPEHSGALNNLAWVLATSPKDEVRDGKRAIELGKKACEVTEYKAAHILSTLGAAYAETGDWKNARKWSNKAVQTADEDDMKQLKEELESYKKKKPWREIQETEERPDIDEPRGGSFEL